MDYRNDRNRQDSTHNPYYNQPTRSPYRENPFATAALVCGILSLLSTCTGFISLILGSLGILFAVLGSRKGKRMHQSAAAGIALSSMGLAFSVVILIVSFIQLPYMLKDDATRRQLDSLYESMTGQTFTEIMEEYGVNIDE